MPGDSREAVSIPLVVAFAKLGWLLFLKPASLSSDSGQL